MIGGGAAGLFFAASAGSRRKRILVLERNAQVARKVLISGGGRCNFTNLSVSADNFVSQNPHFAKSALARFTPQDFLELVRKYKIQFYEKKLGQLFCTENSAQVVNMLLAECEQAKVSIITGCTVERVEKQEEFSVFTDQGAFTGSALIIATGGLSFAKVGATDLGYRIAEQFGLEIVPTRPSLVPLVLDGPSYRDLAGISVNVDISTGDASFRENILFTHRGMSGPAILQISNYWKKGLPVTVDLMPGTDVSEFLQRHRGSEKRLDNFLSRHLPAKVIARIIDNDLRLSTMSESDIEQTSEEINNWKIRFRYTEGYDRAEVTLGGVSTDELSSKTFESRKVPGLFFIGEVVDVTGWLGGYNFQWAWASGHAAAESV